MKRMILASLIPSIFLCPFWAYGGRNVAFPITQDRYDEAFFLFAGIGALLVYLGYSRRKHAKKFKPPLFAKTDSLLYYGFGSVFLILALLSLVLLLRR